MRFSAVQPFSLSSRSAVQPSNGCSTVQPFGRSAVRHNKPVRAKIYLDARLEAASCTELEATRLTLVLVLSLLPVPLLRLLHLDLPIQL